MRRTAFAILCLEGAVLSFNVAATAALVPAIARDFGISPIFTGSLVWVYMLSYGIAALFYGPLARIYDARRIELVSFLCFCLANVLMATAQSPAVLIWARFCMGLFGASVIPLVLILIAQLTKPEQRGKQVGIFFSATFVASLLGLFLSGFVPWRWLYLIPAIFGFLLWLHMYWYLQSFPPRTAGAGVTGRFNYRQTFKNKQAVAIYLYIFLISLMYHGIQQWLSVYFAQNFLFQQLTISMLITVTSLSGIFGEVAGGYLSDSFGRIKIMSIGTALMVACVVCLMVRMPVLLIAFVMAFWGFGWTLNHAGISTLLTDLPQKFLHESASLNSSVRFLSGGIGTMLGGVLLKQNLFLYFGVFIAGLCFVLWYGTQCKIRT